MCQEETILLTLDSSHKELQRETVSLSQFVMTTMTVIYHSRKGADGWKNRSIGKDRYSLLMDDLANEMMHASSRSHSLANLKSFAWGRTIHGIASFVAHAMHVSISTGDVDFAFQLVVTPRATKGVAIDVLKKAQTTSMTIFVRAIENFTLI